MLMKYFTVAWPDTGSRIWMFLYHVSTQGLFKERKIWDRVCLRNNYCGMARLMNTNLDVFMQCQHIITVLRKKNMEQGLFKKYSKFQKIWRNIILKNIILFWDKYPNTKTILKKLHTIFQSDIFFIRTIHGSFYLKGT